jgi:hypothetical protein
VGWFGNNQRLSPDPSDRPFLCAGALSGWVLYNKSIPLAPLELTVEVPERIDARGEVVMPLEEDATREALRRLRARAVSRH